MGEPIESNGKEILSFRQILLYGILSNIWWWCYMNEISSIGKETPEEKLFV
jgi:hypothetical protein